MKYHFIKNASNHICGYTDARIEDLEGNLLSNYIEVENPTQELLIDFIKYKSVDGVILKMSDEEFQNLYPNFDKPAEPSEQDKINAMLMKQIAELKAGVNK